MDATLALFTISLANLGRCNRGRVGLAVELTVVDDDGVDAIIDGMLETICAVDVVELSMIVVLVGVIELYVPKIVFEPIIVDTYVIGGNVVVSTDVIVSGESRV